MDTQERPTFERARAERLIAVLEGVRDTQKRLDMNTWATNSSWDEEDGETDCGTACCAFGYASLDPVLRAEGLSLELSYEVFQVNPIREDIQDIETFNRIVSQKGFFLWSAMPTYKEFTGIDAAEKFFGISPPATWWLFMPEAYEEACDDAGEITPDMVIERVRDLIAHEGRCPEDRKGDLE